LSAIRTQLTEKLQTAEQERGTLITVFKERVLEGMDLSALVVLDADAENKKQPQIEQLQALWKQKEAQHKQELEQLRSEMKSLQQNGSSAPTTSSSGSGSSEAAALREQLQAEHKRAMAAMAESLAQQHAQEIAKLPPMPTPPRLLALRREMEVPPRRRISRKNKPRKCKSSN
jgi:hypothetical protein